MGPARWGWLAAYLYGIARHRLLKLLKKERNFVSLDEDEDEATWGEKLLSKSNPFSELSRSETIETVRHAIHALPPHYREVVLLCNMHELNYEQAAEVIGCAVGTVRSRLHRARNLLIEKLQGLRSIEASPRTDSETEGPNSRDLTRTRIAI